MPCKFLSNNSLTPQMKRLIVYIPTSEKSNDTEAQELVAHI
jgi:hypothetical protein